MPTDAITRPSPPPATAAALAAEPLLRLAVMEIAFAAQVDAPDATPLGLAWLMPLAGADLTDPLVFRLFTMGLVQAGGRLGLTAVAVVWLHGIGFEHHGAQLIREARCALFGDDWPDRAEALGIANGFSFSFLHGCAVEGVAS